jgi:UDP-N-acetylmuramoyl-tripeptide--D-alanyl-D-alanine ligase
MFKIDELLVATKGRLVKGRQDTLLIGGVSTDSRTIKESQAFIAIKGDNFDGHDFIDEALEKGTSCIIAEGGSKKAQTKDVNFIEVKDTLKALGDIARFHRRKFNIPVIAVTGSNGKTTTKEMIARVLAKKLNVLKNEGTKNNQIGVPLTLLNLNASHDIAVLEIGTNHFGEVEYLTRICRPNIGVITNIGLAHLEFFKDLEGVFKEKYSLIEKLEEPYLAILNADDKLLKKQVQKISKKPFIVGVGIRNRSDFFASGVKMIKDKV